MILVLRRYKLFLVSIIFFLCILSIYLNQKNIQESITKLQKIEVSKLIFPYLFNLNAFLVNIDILTCLIDNNTNITQEIFEKYNHTFEFGYFQKTFNQDSIKVHRYLL